MVSAKTLLYFNSTWLRIRSESGEQQKLLISHADAAADAFASQEIIAVIAGRFWNGPDFLCAMNIIMISIKIVWPFDPIWSDVPRQLAKCFKKQRLITASVLHLLVYASGNPVGIERERAEGHPSDEYE